MRGTILLIAFTTCSSTLAQPTFDDRTNIVYVIGRVTSATDKSCLIDIGAVHTVNSQDKLALFRPVQGYFSPLGQITAEHVESTTTQCAQRVKAQPNDVVIAARELSELRPGARHRERILRRQVVRSYRQRSSTTVNNLRTAEALSSYQRSFPKWERNRATVAGTLLSQRLQKSNDERLERLQAQLNLMRRHYMESTDIVAAAGPGWEGVMPILAGQTAAAGHALHVENEQEQPKEGEQKPRLAADELRSRVFARVFHLEREQQNVLAMIVASLLDGTARQNSILLRTAIAQTQFPDLETDEQLMEDLEVMLLDIRDSI